MGQGSNCKRCAKNRKDLSHHTKFTPVKDFDVYSLASLPAKLPLPKSGIVEYVKACAPLVVRISSRLVSNKRPGLKKSKNYPFADKRGCRVSHLGSGWVRSVFGPVKDICRCHKCAKSRSGKTFPKYWKVMIYTARHFVHNEEEARECEAVLFDGSAAEDTLTQTILTGNEFLVAGTDRDYCRMVCFTHDEALAQQLKKLCDVRYKTLARLQQEMSADLDIPRDVAVPVVVISYPHGCQCCTSVGKLKVVPPGAEGGASLVQYTAATCVGCSGAMVLAFGRLVGDHGQRFISCYPHSGTVQGQKLGESDGWV